MSGALYNSARPRTAHVVARALVVAIAFGAAAWVGIAWTRDATRIAALWLPNAVLIGVLLRSRDNFCPLSLLACFLANVAVDMALGDAGWRAIGLSLINTMEIIVVVRTMRILCGDAPAMDDLRDLGVFFAACIGATLMSGLFAASLLTTHNHAGFLALWQAWTVADLLGLVIVAPCVMIAIDGWRGRRRTTPREALEWVALLLFTVAVSGAIFVQTHFPFLFVLCPVVLLAAFRFGKAGTALAIATITIIASLGTMAGHGPITLVRGGVTDKLVTLQLFLAVSFAMGLPVAAVLARRAALLRDLADSRDFSAQILEDLREVVFKTDAEGRWVFLNSAWEPLTGFPIAASLGRRTVDFLHPDCLREAARVYPAIVRGEIGEATLVQRFVAADGGLRHIEVSVRRLTDAAGRFAGTSGAIRDITDRTRAEAALAEREAELSLLARNATDAVFRIDLAGTCLYASPSARDLVGVPAEQLVGANLLARVHPEDEAPVRRAVGLLGRGLTDRQLVAWRSELVGNPGHYVWLEANCGLLRDPDTRAPAEIIASVRNVTARKAMEAALVDARLRAEDAAAAKSAFLATMSHEIRTPMNGVIGFSELILAGQLQPEQRHHAELIVESGRAMLRLIDDILDMSRIEAAQMQIASEPVNLAHQLRGATEIVRPLAHAKGVALTLDIDPALPRFVTGDALRLRQVVLNLVGNAAKFTSRGSITVRANRRCGLDGKPRLGIAVIDTGIGIPDDKLDDIFRQFTQADNSTARRFGGTGLGLSISLGLARLMDGTLHVSSEEGKGSIFTLDLPLRPAEAPDADPGAKDAPLAPVSVAGRVLVAEDHDINQALIVAMLGRMGVESDVVSNGAEAIDAVRDAAREGKAFALVLMDMQMPVVDGLEATRRLRAMGFGAATLPIVALTANAFAEDAAACRAAGMQDHLAKPVRVAELTRVLTHYAGASDAIQEMPTPPAAGLSDRYAARKAATLAALDDGTPIAELREMLHRLAGTAAYFGDAALGEAAAALDHDLRELSPEDARRHIAQAAPRLRAA